MAEEKKAVAETISKRALTVVDEFKVQLERDYSKAVVNYFEGDIDRAMKFKTAVLRSVQKTPELLNCDRGTLMTAFMSAAEYQLDPSSVSGEAYVLPYKGKAQFQLGYKGWITLYYRAGVTSISSSIVYSKDYFEYEEGLNQKLVHKPDMLAEDRGEPVAVYAVAELNGSKIFKVMSKAEVMKYREFSQAKDSQYSPWNAKNDPGLFMWQKTVIKVIGKTLPQNETIVKAMEQDNQDSTISNNRINTGDVFSEGKRPVDIKAQITGLLNKLNVDTSDPEQTREEIKRLTSLEAVQANLEDIKGRLSALVTERQQNERDTF